MKAGGALTACLAGCALLAAPADAALTLAPDTKPGAPGTQILAFDTSETANTVDLGLAEGGTQMFVSDPTGVTGLPAGCRRDDATRVSCPRASFIRIQVRAGPGADTVSTLLSEPFRLGGKEPFPLVADLGPGSDGFTGGPGVNFARGGPGADSLLGGPAADFLFGQGGNDRGVGGNGKDLIIGGPGGDRLFGNAGTDILAGEQGNDRLSADAGRADLTRGGRGKDVCIGQPRDFVASCEKIRVRR